MKLKDLAKGMSGTIEIEIEIYDTTTNKTTLEIYNGLVYDIPEIVLEKAELNPKDFMYHHEDFIKLYINPNEELEHWVKHKDDPVEEPNDTPEELERIAEEEKNWKEHYDNESVKSYAEQILAQLKLLNKMFFYKSFKGYWADEDEETWNKLVKEFAKEIFK